MLDIKVIVMLIEAGIFLVTLVLLNKWLFEPLVSFMEQRDQKLAKDKKAVSSNADEVKRYQEEIASIIENAKVEAAQIKRKAVEVAKAEANSIIESEMRKVEIEKQAFNKELEEKKDELLKALETNSSELKEMLSTKLKGIA
jgi:F-type H+-transporting ATPase subunit b